MEGVPGWAVLGLQGKEVESPEASGHVWCEKGGASHLKKYIYILYNLYEASWVRTEVRCGVSEWTSSSSSSGQPQQGSRAGPAQTLKLVVVFWGGT